VIIPGFDKNTKKEYSIKILLKEGKYKMKAKALILAVGLVLAASANAQMPMCAIPSTTPTEATIPGFIFEIVSHATGLEIPLVPGAIARVNLNYPGLPNFMAKELPLPIEVGGARLLVDGVPAPILRTGRDNSHSPFPAEFVLFQVPSSTKTLQIAEVRVSITQAGQQCLGFPTQVSVYPGWAQVFTTKNGIAFFDAASQKAALVGTPDQVLSMYVTGLGKTSATTPDGFAPTHNDTALETVVVRVDGITAEVKYAGSTVGMVGMGQINFRVPRGLSKGMHFVYVEVGGRETFQPLYVYEQ
jgi:uncharacterized protein (TIGR03437 family)